jgi:hypothetical protein
MFLYKPLLISTYARLFWNKAAATILNPVIKNISHIVSNNITFLVLDEMIMLFVCLFVDYAGLLSKRNPKEFKVVIRRSVSTHCIYIEVAHINELFDVYCNFIIAKDLWDELGNY